MCHESFELPLGPRVNFVIGPNGSGKSALLTALVVVLGGRATTTSRAKRADDFVMYGKKYAKVTCIIHNYDKIMEKEQAFKPDDYGKRIVVEKTIFSGESSRLVLKNDRDKKVSERKQELDEMLEHFGILINNPICILNQEVSKSFLHSKKPEDKFELFMKATNLEQIELDYNEAKTTYGNWNECNNRKSVGFKVLDSEYASCREKVSFLINRAKLQDTHRDLIRELVWAMIRDHEVRANQSQTKIDRYTKAIQELKSDSETRLDLIEKSKLKVEQHQEKRLKCDQECDMSKRKLDENRRKDTLLRSRRIDLEQLVDTERRKIARYERDKAATEKSITETRKKLSVDTSSEENERRKLRIETLEREMPSEKAREKTTRQHNEQLNRSMNDVRTEMHKLRLRKTSLNNEITAKQGILRRLKGGETDALGKYGDHMVRICEEINKYHESKQFREKPLGPLGYFVKLKNPQVAKAMELHLGKNAYAFVCDNVQDSQKLTGIIKNIRSKSQYDKWAEPLILIRRNARRHDVSRHKARHDIFKTLLDHIEICEDAVYNILVDRTKLETVLYIPDYKDAENLMITPPLIPAHTTRAYTGDSHVMYPRTVNSGYRCIYMPPPERHLFTRGNSNDIRDTETQITNLEAELRDTERNLEKLEQDYQAQRKEYDGNYCEIRKILEGIRNCEQELLNLKTTIVAPQPEELSAFENELDSCLAKISQCKQLIEQHNAELATLEDERNDIAREREAIMEISKQRANELQKVLKKIDEEHKAIVKHKDTISENEMSVRSSESKMAEEMKDLEKHHMEIADARRNVDENDKPDTIRETSLVQAEKRKVECQLNTEIEEGEDPDELLAKLRVRMKEIENLVELKEHNQQNFNSATTMLKNRDDGFKSLRSITVNSVATTFASVMRAMEMNGMLKIHLDDYIVDGHVVSRARTLEMSVDTTTQRGLSQTDRNTSNADRDSTVPNRAIRSQPQAAPAATPRIKRARVETGGASSGEKENRSRLTDTRSLSGGERSFSTVAFVLALWHHCSSPFKLMDEIDVFMDMVTRRMSYNALINFAQVTENPGQFIFFSPLELPNFDDSAHLVRVYEMPKIIRKGGASQPGPNAGCSSSPFMGTAGGDE